MPTKPYKSNICECGKPCGGIRCKQCHNKIFLTGREPRKWSKNGPVVYYKRGKEIENVSMEKRDRVVESR